MFKIQVEGYFSAAHRLKGYQGKCEELHGHNWKVQVFLKGEKLNAQGMLLDFKELKAYLKDILQKLDHSYLNEIAPFDDINPTSENLAHFIFQELKKNLNRSRCRIHKVTVWETDKASASFTDL